jgi:adenylate kinase family enzyme
MIILISGSINSGKSTVAKIIQKELKNTALVEIDALRAMIDWMPIDKAVPINLKNAVAVIKNFVEAGIHVIVPYPLSQKNYDYVQNELSKLGTDIFVFTLAPRLEKALNNRGDRKLEKSEIERIKYHYNIGIASPTFGTILDNSDETPQETARKILKNIKIN